MLHTNIVLKIHIFTFLFNSTLHRCVRSINSDDTKNTRRNVGQFINKISLSLFLESRATKTDTTIQRESVRQLQNAADVKPARPGQSSFHIPPVWNCLISFPTSPFTKFVYIGKCKIMFAVGARIPGYVQSDQVRGNDSYGEDGNITEIRLLRSIVTANHRFITGQGERVKRLFPSPRFTRNRFQFQLSLVRQIKLKDRVIIGDVHAPWIPSIVKLNAIMAGLNTLAYWPRPRSTQRVHHEIQLG